MSKRPKNRKPLTKQINCFNCSHCLYIEDGDYICDMTNDVIIVEFSARTHDFYQCKGKDFEII